MYYFEETAQQNWETIRTGGALQGETDGVECAVDMVHAVPRQNTNPGTSSDILSIFH